MIVETKDKILLAHNKHGKDTWVQFDENLPLNALKHRIADFCKQVGYNPALVDKEFNTDDRRATSPMSNPLAAQESGE